MFAEHGDVVSVDLTQLVAGVVLQGELRTFASNRDAGNLAYTREVIAGEQERRVDAAVVESAVAQGLVEVKIYATTVAIMQDEVPRTVAGPGVEPIDSLIGEGCDETFEVDRVDPDVEI
ncbi:hypothetical protein [Kribbella sp. VKM Ac-2569]|uniref:hypothetical protein n=1 Tax=Kribbella sp. VKM Ac-2569 TaxID=2512220 RepID=UPI001F543E60|nr:hypothetical protein [Kribbella sp. VKM Ac-2569]